MFVIKHVMFMFFATLYNMISYVSFLLCYVVMLYNMLSYAMLYNMLCCVLSHVILCYVI